MTEKTELRCDKGRILFGFLTDGVFEVKCRSRFCGAEPGVVVIHRFSSVTGDLLGTRKFRDPATATKERRLTEDGSHRGTSVRSA